MGKGKDLGESLERRSKSKERPILFEHLKRYKAEYQEKDSIRASSSGLGVSLFIE
jgi:hypothetical protein